ncbi:hypothetical protein DK59_3127 [Brucella abortus bv. 4 str. 292]|nr:hypothetical protein DK59_3127 [Brucella abortus bv. 4 str. 292]
MINRQCDIDIVYLEPSEQFGCPCIHLVIINETACGWLATKEDILRDRQVWHHHQFLMDDDNTRSFGIANATGFKFFAFPENFTSPCAMGINTRQHFHQGGLARPVFTAQPDTFSRAHFQVNAIQRLDAVELFTDVSHFQKIFGHQK